MYFFMSYLLFLLLTALLIHSADRNFAHGTLHGIQRRLVLQLSGGLRGLECHMVGQDHILHLHQGVINIGEGFRLMNVQTGCLDLAALQSCN